MDIELVRRVAEAPQQYRYFFIESPTVEKGNLLDQLSSERDRVRVLFYGLAVQMREAFQHVDERLTQVHESDVGFILASDMELRSMKNFMQSVSFTTPLRPSMKMPLQIDYNGGRVARGARLGGRDHGKLLKHQIEFESRGVLVGVYN